MLAAWVGVDKLSVVISPADFRGRGAAAPVLDLPWASEVYALLRCELANYPRA